MPTCPHCKKDIDSLDWLHSERSHDKLYSDGDVSFIATYPADDTDDDFQCPRCEETVTTSYTEAIAFLEITTKEPV